MVLTTLAAAASLAAAFTPTTDDNMNGEYLLSKTPNAPKDKEFSTDFKNYPGGVEYFDVYHGPITSVYSQVWWTSTSNPLPDDIVQRFKGKVMAVVGMESDQVRKGAGPNGEDVSVPISMAYNHHHDTAVHGSGSHLEVVDLDEAMKTRGRDYVRMDKGKAWVAVEHKPSEKGFPTSAMFSDGNGGEYRKSLHVYAPPFAQMVESPTTFAGSPMQIDTWNRDKMDINGGSPFVSGPVPKNSLAPTTGPDAIYSGLLECPLTTRIRKEVNGGAVGFDNTTSAKIFACGASGKPHACRHRIDSAAHCFASVAKIIGNATKVTTKTVSEDSIPAGCSVSTDAKGGSAQVYFNTKASDACCGATETAGAQQSLVKLSVAVSAGAKPTATITITGPSTVWFGVGFNATLMADLPYAITVEGSAGNVVERKLGSHDGKHPAGTVLKSSVTVVSNTVAAGLRTVVLTRPLQGATSEHYSFDPQNLRIDFINAVGSSPAFAFHKASTAATLALWPTGSTSHACICTEPAPPFGKASGHIHYLPTGEKVGFRADRCPAAPREDLLSQRNPTCDIRTYRGGLSTCHHGWILLDAEQQIPWKDQPLVYYKKFRVYFQEVNMTAPTHLEIKRTDWGIAADGDHAEYDVPQCAAGTPASECTHTISGTWMPVPHGAAKKQRLVAVHAHCHAPTCIRVEMWNNDTGKLICRQEPIYGGAARDNRSSSLGSNFSEPGYIATPPCLWGSVEDGLEEPPVMNGVTIRVLSVTNNTYSHHGEMALPEVSLVEY